MKIRTVIVDDEPLARKRVSHMLAKETDCEITAECGDGLKAINVINRSQPNLIFLDVQMPEIDGFDVLRELKTEIAPAVIFVTAYDQFTIQAFDAHAVDYLLKPFSEQRFRQSVDRARDRLRRTEIENQSNESFLRLLDYLKPFRNFIERIIVSHKNRLVILPIHDIDWIEAYGNYLKIHSAENTFLLRETMNNFAARINPKKFLRIHRSALVNIDRIKELQPIFGGQYSVVLRDGTKLTLSRNYRKGVLDVFEV